MWVPNSPSAIESFYGVSPDIINVEEARSDIRSQTRAGYSTFNSYAGLQALVDVAGENAVFYFPANGIFDLGAGLDNDIETKSNGQGFISFGPGASIKNGGIKLLHSRCRAESFHMYGVSTYGIYMAPGIGTTSGPTREARFGGIIPPDWNGAHLRNLMISDKTVGVENSRHMMWGKAERVITGNCTTGWLFDMTTTPLDSGDWDLVSCGAHTCVTGLKAAKIGGLRLTTFKAQSCSDVGVLLESKNDPNIGAGVQGIYMTNCTFENSTNWDVKVTSQAGVPSGSIPHRIFIAGGHWHKVLLNQCYDVGIAPGNIGTGSTLLQQDVGATNVVVIGVANSRLKRTGAGTSFLDVGMDSTNGAYIQAGGVLKIKDSWGEKTLQQLWSGT